MSRIAPLIVLVLSAAIVGTALLTQYWGRLVPCELCLYERWPYYAVIALAALAVVVGRRDASRAALMLAALIFVVSAALAFYHVGDELQWSVAGVSLAGLNLIASLVMIAVSWRAMIRVGRA